MGGSLSQEDMATIQAEVVLNVYNSALDAGLMPDVGIDDSLLKYSRMDSHVLLQDYAAHLRAKVLDRIPDFIFNLGSTLAAFVNVPCAVGLGALVISMVLETIFSVVAETKEDSATNLLRRVFAEEKASGVQNSMDEYLKRYRMHLGNMDILLKSTSYWDEQLSNQLTILRNSMLNDGQMSARALKHWVNGAVFHTQMLIHYVRLKKKVGSTSSDIEAHTATVHTVIDIYLADVRKLLEKFKSYKMSTTELYTGTDGSFAYGPPAMARPIYCILKDTVTGEKTLLMRIKGNGYLYANSVNAFFDYTFSNYGPILKLETYFTDLKADITTVISQDADFIMSALK